MTTSPFPISAEYTGIAIAYRNPVTKYIHEKVLPTRPVSKREFEWMKYATEESYTIPTTRVGRTAKPNQVEFTGTRQGDSVIDYALDSPVPNSDIENAPPNYDPRGRAVMQTTDLIELDREKRAADLIFTLGTYSSALRTTLSGTSQWSDFTNSDPIYDIETALDLMLVRANIWAIGRLGWSVVRRHPKIVNALRGYQGTTLANSSNFGKVTQEDLAAYLELEEIVVGENRSNTAKPGQTASYSRLWGKHSALLVRNPNADLISGGVTFGLTAQQGTRISGAIPDPDIGAEGGVRVRVAEKVKEVVMSQDAGYFFQNIVA